MYLLTRRCRKNSWRYSKTARRSAVPARQRPRSVKPRVSPTVNGPSPTGSVAHHRAPELLVVTPETGSRQRRGRNQALTRALPFGAQACSAGRPQVTALSVEQTSWPIQRSVCLIRDLLDPLEACSYSCEHQLARSEEEHNDGNVGEHCSPPLSTIAKRPRYKRQKCRQPTFLRATGTEFRISLLRHSSGARPTLPRRSKNRRLDDHRQGPRPLSACAPPRARTAATDVTRRHAAGPTGSARSLVLRSLGRGAPARRWDPRRGGAGHRYDALWLGTPGSTAAGGTRTLAPSPRGSAPPASGICS